MNKGTTMDPRGGTTHRAADGRCPESCQRRAGKSGTWWRKVRRRQQTPTSPTWQRPISTNAKCPQCGTEGFLLPLTTIHRRHLQGVARGLVTFYIHFMTFYNLFYSVTFLLNCSSPLVNHNNNRSNVSPCLHCTLRANIGLTYGTHTE